MNVLGYMVPRAAIEAGLAAMRGEFISDDVLEAVDEVFASDEDLEATNWISGKVASRLLQRERKAGRIRYIRARRVWMAMESSP